MICNAVEVSVSHTAPVLLHSVLKIISLVILHFPTSNKSCLLCVFLVHVIFYTVVVHTVQFMSRSTGFNLGTASAVSHSRERKERWSTADVLHVNLEFHLYLLARNTTVYILPLSHISTVLTRAISYVLITPSQRVRDYLLTVVFEKTINGSQD